MTNHQDGQTLGECYYCAENEAVFCKLCSQWFCNKCHKEHLISIIENSEYLTPHDYYGMEFLGVKA